MSRIRRRPQAPCRLSALGVMRILLDQNLSPSLRTSLQSLYPDSLHVQDIGLSVAGDLEVWDYAIENGLVIVSKDADFLHLSALYGHPPKVIRLACGNCPTEDIEALLIAYRNDILAFNEDEQQAFLELP